MGDTKALAEVAAAAASGKKVGGSSLVVQRVTRDEGGSAEEPTADEATQGQAEHDLQEENAETSLDQPSQ